MATSFLMRIERGVRQGRDRVIKAKELAPPTLAALLIAPVVASALFYVWTHVAAIRLGYQMSAAGEEHRLLLEENRALRVEVSSLKAPERLKQLAIKHRLAPPRSQQVIRLEPR
jgi:cell division protein FtsL